MRAACLLAALAGPASAHPHVVVDTAMEAVVEDGLLTGVRMTWTYDEFFSLLLTEDLGLDPDADGVLTDAELATLARSVADWPADYGGDLQVTRGSETVALGPRAHHRVEWRDARVVESHLRPVTVPVPADGAVIENFDPYYYVAYTVLAPVAVTDPACAAALVPADLTAGQAQVDAMFGALDVAGAAQDVQLPPVGFAFADRVELRCAP